MSDPGAQEYPCVTPPEGPTIIPPRIFTFARYIDIRYTRNMIRNIANRMTQDVYDGVNSRHARKLPREIHAKARRLLDQINSAPTLDFLVFHRAIAWRSCKAT